MDERRLRAWEALELGPLWRARRASGEGVGERPGEGASASQASSVEGLGGTISATAPVTAPPRAPAAAPPAIQSTIPSRIRAATSAMGTDAASGAASEAASEAASGAALDATPAAAGAGPITRAAAGPRPEVGAMGWPELRAAVAACRGCGLCEGRNRTVFGAGPEDARWLVVGEGPGSEEDASGEPFVGQAGRLLDAMLAAIDLDRRRNVFIANVVKCRPPGNRIPLPEETAQCLPFLRRQIELLAPDFVLLLGRVAAHALLETDASVGSLRGRVHRLRAGGREIPAVVTWHPSYLLRRPEEKGLAWADLCLARERFEAAQAAQAARAGG